MKTMKRTRRTPKEKEERGRPKKERATRKDKAETKKTKRLRRNCPVKECKAQIIDLPRHLRDVHNSDKDTAKKATSRFGMRKSFLPKAVKEKSELDNGKRIHKDYQRHRPCPIQGCKSVVKRLSGPSKHPCRVVVVQRNSEEGLSSENLETIWLREQGGNRERAGFYRCLSWRRRDKE